MTKHASVIVLVRANRGKSRRLHWLFQLTGEGCQVLCHAQASSAQICVGKSHTTSLLGCSEVVARETAARPCGG